MQYKIKFGSPEKITTGCLVVTVSDGAKLSPSAKILDQVSTGLLTRLVKRGDLGRKVGKTLLLHDIPNVKAQRVLLAHCGDQKDFNDKKYGTFVNACIAAIKDSGTKEATFFLDEIVLGDRDLDWKISQAIMLCEDAMYQFTQLKSKKSDKPAKLSRIHLALSNRQQSGATQAAIQTATAIAQGKQLAKTLGNLPGNICTPNYLADQAKALAKSHKKITTSVIEEKQMTELGMGALLSVAAGSEEPAKLIVMNYKGGKKDEAPQVLVGKGVTFDTGGISLKPGAAMDEMKFDMCGAASVFGTLLAVAELELPINVIGIVAAAENMPDGRATKPGDIVTSLSGQTIEILNTDAEGRLVLCDALTYADMFNPAAIIDIATLTGACVIALGHHATGLFSNQDSLAVELLRAGNETNDRAWHMPLWDDYQDQLDSNFADMGNVGGRSAGSITAACFLSRFTKEQRWAHLDIAGVAWDTGKNKGATGRPVPLLTQYLIDRAEEIQTN